MFQSRKRVAVVEIHIFQLGKKAGEFLHIAGHEADSYTVQLTQFILGPHLGAVDSFVALLLALSTSPLMLSGRAELELPLTAPAIIRRIKEIDMTRSPSISKILRNREALIVKQQKEMNQRFPTYLY